MDEKEKEQKEFEEKKKGFLDILTMMAAANKEKDEFAKATRDIANTMFVVYKSFCDAGFNPHEALELTKALLMGR